MLISSVSLSVAASTLLKIGGRNINFDQTIVQIMISYVSSPLIVIGFAVYALAAVLWIYCLAQFDLSYVTFVSSAQYILLLLVSIMVFHEQISLMKWAGCFFILVGVICWLRG